MNGHQLLLTKESNYGIYECMGKMVAETVGQMG